MSRSLLWICLLQCSLAGADPPAAQTPIPIDELVRQDEFGTIKISPDGEFIAMSVGKGGRSALTFISLKEKKVVSGVKASDPFEIADFHWVSATRLIYLSAEHYSDYAEPNSTGEMFAIDRDGHNHKQIYGYSAGQSKVGTNLRVREASLATPKLISILKGDRENILLAEYPWRLQGRYWIDDPDAMTRITRLNVYSGLKHSMGSAPLRDARILVDRNDQVRFAVGLNDQRKLAVSWKPDPAGAWTAFELAGFREESAAPQCFGGDNHTVYFTGVRVGESLRALYRLDLQTQAVERVHAFDGADVSGVLKDFADREVIGVYTDAERQKNHWLMPGDPAAQLQVALERAFPGQNVHITSATDDGHLAIAFVNSDTNPGDYYLFDTKTRKADYLRSTRQWIDPQRMRPKQPLQITARDGLTLHGYLTRPTGDMPHPLIVLPHGDPADHRDRWQFDSEAQLLASRGYAVLQVNYRGSPGYGMDFQAAGHGQWGAKMQDDLTDATRWAIEQRITDANRICIYGVDYGGYAALMGVAREPSLYRCAIGYGGFYDLEQTLTSAPNSDTRSGRAYLERLLGNDPADLRSRSPVYNAERIQAPVLLIHGKQDEWADFEQAKRMKSALETHRKPVELMALSGENHIAYDADTRREVYERILTFLDQHLKQ